MPRTARIITTQTPMHIMCRGNNRLAVLDSHYDKQQIYWLMYRFKADNQVDILHYCIMNNHLHLIIWLKPAGDLSRFMKQLSLAYCHHYIKQYNYCGHLWQGRFKSIIIRSDSQALQCGKYIELNPVRAGMISDPGDYPFSSYRHYVKGKEDILVTPNPAFTGLGQTVETRRLAYSSFLTAKDYVLNFHKYLKNKP